MSISKGKLYKNLLPSVEQSVILKVKGMVGWKYQYHVELEEMMIDWDDGGKFTR